MLTADTRLAADAGGTSELSGPVDFSIIQRMAELEQTLFKLITN